MLRRRHLNSSHFSYGNKLRCILFDVTDVTHQLQYWSLVCFVKSLLPTACAMFQMKFYLLVRNFGE